MTKNYLQFNDLKDIGNNLRRIIFRNKKVFYCLDNFMTRHGIGRF